MSVPKIFTLTLNPCFDQTKYTSNSIESGQVLKEDKEDIIAGGKGINISKVLNNLRIKSKAIIVAGGDNSTQFLSMLPQLDIVSIPCSGKIRTNMVITNGQEEIKINQQGYDFNSTEMARIKTKIWNLIEANQLWILSGSMPPAIDSGFYTELIEMIHRSGSKVWLDSSGPALTTSLNSSTLPDLIKPNRSELESLIGQLSDDYVELGNQIRKQIIKDSNLEVVVTLDKDGCLLVNSREEIHVPILNCIKAINTVGAGDSFLAGMVAGKSLGLNDTHSLELAMCVAGLTVSKELGQYPTMSEVSNMLKVNFRNNFPIERLE
jgi:1-phosphofructokinase